MRHEEQQLNAALSRVSSWLTQPERPGRWDVTVPQELRAWTSQLDNAELVQNVEAHTGLTGRPRYALTELEPVMTAIDELGHAIAAARTVAAGTDSALSCKADLADSVRMLAFSRFEYAMDEWEAVFDPELAAQHARGTAAIFELRQRLDQRVSTYETNPPVWVRDNLGPAPAAGEARSVWREAVGRAELYRWRHNLTDERSGIGDQPPSPAAHRGFHAARQGLLRAQRHLRPRPTMERGPSIEI